MSDTGPDGPEKPKDKWTIPDLAVAFIGMAICSTLLVLVATGVIHQ